MTATKISSAQQRIIDAMEEGMILSSTESFVDEALEYRFADICKPNSVTYCKNVHIATIDAMLKKSLIVEKDRWISSIGEAQGKPAKSWHIVYQLPPLNTEQPETCPHWPAGAKVMRKSGKLDIGVTLDETWQNWDGNGYFNKVRWEGSRVTTTIRADRLKPAQEAGEQHA